MDAMNSKKFTVQHQISSYTVKDNCNEENKLTEKSSEHRHGLLPARAHVDVVIVIESDVQLIGS
jgi:hypothetical protein